VIKNFSGFSVAAVRDDFCRLTVRTLAAGFPGNGSAHAAVASKSSQTLVLPACEKLSPRAAMSDSPPEESERRGLFAYPHQGNN
jgi:hypothetical protein